MGDDYKLVGASRERQGNGAIVAICVLLCNSLNLRAVSIEDGDIQTGTESSDVSGGTGEGRLLELCQTCV